MRLFISAFREMGLNVIPSDANFVMIALKDADQAERLTGRLLEEGIIIRPLHAFGLPQCIRISTGTGEASERCVDAMRIAVNKEESYAANDGSELSSGTGLPTAQGD
jgi:histidinol-phosphate aminotransferase